jgi:tetratricopeptide (TPR) repeat protein
MEFSAGEPPEYRRLVDEALADLDRGDGDPSLAEDRFGRAAALVPPGFERAFVLGQIATIALDLGRADQAVAVLLSDADWPHHVPAAFATLTRAGVEARSAEAFRWLATRPAEYHETGIEPLDNGVQIALRQVNDVEFAERLTDLAAELCGDGDPIVCLLRGLVREKQDRRGDAIAAYVSAAELGGTDPRIYRRLTLLLDKEKRRDEAKQWCRRALEIDLDAAARQDIEKRLSRLEAAPGAKRAASAHVLPLYVRTGAATIERVTAFPVQVTQAVQGPATAWGSGTRRKSPHLFIAQIGGDAAEYQLTFRPIVLRLAPEGAHCLALGSAEDGTCQAALVREDGESRALVLPAAPDNVVALADGWLVSFRSGVLEKYTWSGERSWRSQLPGPGAYAHFLAADSEIAFASHLNTIYEVDTEAGRVNGPVVIEPKSSEYSAGTVSFTMEYGEASAWVAGLAVDRGRGFAVAADQFFEILAGPRLLPRERFDDFDHVRIPMFNDAGRAVAFQGNETFRAIQADGSLGAEIRCPWRQHGLARLDDHRFASYGARRISIIDASGQESHKLEAANEVRSLRVIDANTCRAVIGKDVLALRTG